MRWRPILSHRHPLWRFSGAAMLALVLGFSGLYMMRGPRPIKPQSGSGPFGGGTRGKYGTVTEQLGQGRFELSYDTVLGGEEDGQLQGVKGRLEEPQSLWLMEAPAAQKREGAWVLQGPLGVEARVPADGRILGHGSIQAPGPALKWDQGAWEGLSSLVWETLDGPNPGRWILPPGWRRDLDGRFVVDRQQPVRWESLAKGALRWMEADRSWVTLGLESGELEGVRAQLEGGAVQARLAKVDPAWIRWFAPIAFQRADGWTGSAQRGEAPRPKEGQLLEQVELGGFRAVRQGADGPESLRSEGVRWTHAGLRLEGDVHWEQPLEQGRLSLRAPRILIREAPGADLPAALPLGEAWAEGQAVLAWNGRTLSSPHIEVQHRTRRWHLQAPALGRGPEGTFAAGAAQGDPRHWDFEGPIQASLTNGGMLRGAHLSWEERVWVLTGRPATWNRLRERLSGPRIIRRDDGIEFPDGVSGSLAAAEGDLTLRAERAEKRGDLVVFSGRVECRSRAWSLRADRISATLGPGQEVKQVEAQGSVTLRGRMGEGWGEALVLDLGTRVAHWTGRVRGLAEVPKP